MNETVHIRNLEKFQPGYKDRKHLWAKIYYQIFHDDEFQKLHEVDRYRLVSLIVFEVFLEGKPAILTPTNVALLGWKTKKRPISLSLQMLHTFIITDTHDSNECVVDKKEKRIREEKKREEKECVIFDHWDFYGGRGNWKHHKRITYEIKQAITDRLKQYTVEQLTQAIDNYAKVLLSKDYTWTYAWTLRQFLTRHQKPPNQSELQLYRWLDSGFAEDDYLTAAAKTRRIQRGRAAEEPPEQVKVASDGEKLRIRSDLPPAMQARLGKGAGR